MLPQTVVSAHTRFIHTADDEPGLNYLCDGYLAFFDHIDRRMCMMCNLHKQGRAPSDIVAVYTEQDARRGRDDPCTCRQWSQVKALS